MNLPQDLEYIIGQKLAFLALKDYFDNPLQILSKKWINFATRWQLLDKFEIGDETVPALAHFGHTDAVKWLYSHGLYIKPYTKGTMYEVDWSDYPIDMAAANGYLELVQWLFGQGEGFTAFAMDYAAMNGHLEVVKWLHTHGGACTTIAFDATAGAGNLTVLKWLVENRHERWSRSIFKNNDELHPEIYKFIMEQDSTLFHPNLIVNSARCGDLETLKKLYGKNGKEWTNYSRSRHDNYQYTNRAFVEAAKKAHIPVVLWFIEMKLLI